MKIAIVGTGYVVLFIKCLWMQCSEVFALDKISEKIGKINNRRSSIVDTDIEELLSSRKLN